MGSEDEVVGWMVLGKGLFVWSGELVWSGEPVEVRGVGERGLGGWRGEIASAPAVPRN